jgi:hypothetical protein
MEPIAVHQDPEHPDVLDPTREEVAGVNHWSAQT